MSSHVQPTPVKSQVLPAIRDYQEWLTPLAGIKVRGGITGLAFAGSSHWFAFCRRQDVPLPWAEAFADMGADDAGPGDVMLCVKEYMADPHLAQPVLKILPAGSSHAIAGSPQAWLQREAFSKQYTDDLGKLLDRLKQHFPEKYPKVAGYLREWVAAPLAPREPPQPLAVLEHAQPWAGMGQAGPLGCLMAAQPQEKWLKITRGLCYAVFPCSDTIPQCLSDMSQTHTAPAP